MRRSGVLALLLLSATSADAQDSVARLPDIPIATRIRIRAEGLPEGVLLGKVTEMDSVRIGVAVTDNSSAVVIPWRMVSTLEFSQAKDRTTSMRNGALIGLAAGAIVFTSLLKQAQDDPTGDQTQALADLSFRVVPALGAGVGALLGKERWWAVPPYRRMVRDEEYATGIRLDLSRLDDVRVSSSVGPVRGRFVSDEGDTLTVRRGDNVSRLAWPNITAIRVRGSERDKVYGALIGMSLFSGGVAVAESISPRSRATDAAITFLLAGAVGAVIGSEFSPRKWILLPLPRR